MTNLICGFIENMPNIQFYYTPAEAESLIKKAAYGGGYEWGFAEDMAKAARFLMDYDLPAMPVVAKLLPLSPQLTRPIIKDKSIYAANGESLCPIKAATALSDRVTQLNDDTWQVKQVLYPLLLVACLSPMAKFSQRIFRIESEEFCAYISEQGFAYQGNALSALAKTCDIQACRAIEGNLLSANAAAKPVKKADLDIILHYFMLTTVAESEKSRRGAGADEEND